MADSSEESFDMRLYVENVIQRLEQQLVYFHCVKREIEGVIDQTRAELARVHALAARLARGDTPA